MSAHGQVDPLQRPASPSKRAGSVAQLAVALAGTRLVSVGERGVVLYSDDAGATWKQAQVPASVTLTQVRFTGPKLGWAIGHGGLVLHTDDAGETWKKQLDGTQAAALFLASAKASADPSSGAAKALLAEAERLVADGADKPWLDAHFNAKRGIVVGAYGMILATDDGGKSWVSWAARVPNPKGRHLYGVVVVDDRVVLVGEQGSVFVSNDGGRSFAARPTPYTGTYFGVVMLGPERFLAYGLIGNAWLTSDGGATWIKSSTEDASGANINHGLQLADGTVVVGTTGGELLLSKDQGRSFKRWGGAQPGPILGMVELSDGGIVLASLRGVAKTTGPSSRGNK